MPLPIKIIRPVFMAFYGLAADAEWGRYISVNELIEYFKDNIIKIPKDKLYTTLKDLLKMNLIERAPTNVLSEEIHLLSYTSRGLEKYLKIITPEF
jgi:hypothetical protein